MERGGLDLVAGADAVVGDGEDDHAVLALRILYILIGLPLAELMDEVCCEQSVASTDRGGLNCGPASGSSRERGVTESRGVRLRIASVDGLLAHVVVLAFGARVAPAARCLAGAVLASFLREHPKIHVRGDAIMCLLFVLYSRCLCA